MNVKNCKGCGRLFNYIGGLPLCQKCREDAESRFQEVKDYVRDHHGASIRQTSKDCCVEESQIRQWIKEERLTLEWDVEGGPVCRTCGASIPSGNQCDKCKAQLIMGLKAAGRQPAQQSQQQRASKDTPRMRFLDNK